jgi:hypothetical protein
MERRVPPFRAGRESVNSLFRLFYPKKRRFLHILSLKALAFIGIFTLKEKLKGLPFRLGF